MGAHREDGTTGTRLEPRRSLLAGLLIGAGSMAAVDEIVFHQLLSWHHFYDRSTPTAALFSDGLLHAAELVAIVAGMFIIADLLKRRSYAPHHFWSALLLGAGAFQLFDGLVNHKVLRLHQIRYGVDLVPYDVAWNAAALVLLATGLLWWRSARARREAAVAV